MACVLKILSVLSASRHATMRNLKRLQIERASNIYYENFYELLRFFVSFTQDVQEFLRRGWNDFRRETLTLEAPAAYNIPPEELGTTLSSAFVKAGEYRALLQVA